MSYSELLLAAAGIKASDPRPLHSNRPEGAAAASKGTHSRGAGGGGGQRRSAAEAAEAAAAAASHPATPSLTPTSAAIKAVTAALGANTSTSADFVTARASHIFDALLTRRPKKTPTGTAASPTAEAVAAAAAAAAAAGGGGGELDSCRRCAAFSASDFLPGAPDADLALLDPEWERMWEGWLGRREEVEEVEGTQTALGAAAGAAAEAAAGAVADVGPGPGGDLRRRECRGGGAFLGPIPGDRDLESYRQRVVRYVRSPEYRSRAASISSISSSSSASSVGVDRGILISAGGSRYTTNLIVTLHLLRNHFHSTLPVEVAWQGPNEMDPVTWTSLERHFAPIRGFDVRASPHPVPELHGQSFDATSYSGKVYALIQSRFRQVLMIDADSLPLRDPATLFDDPRFVQYGSLFWPDAWTGQAQSSVYGLYGIEYGKAQRVLSGGKGFGRRDTESGQLLIDRGRHLDVLEALLLINRRPDANRYLLWGDKDTFPLAFAMVGKAHCFNQVAVPPSAYLYWSPDKLLTKATNQRGPGWLLGGFVQNLEDVPYVYGMEEDTGSSNGAGDGGGQRRRLVAGLTGGGGGAAADAAVNDTAAAGAAAAAAALASHHHHHQQQQTQNEPLPRTMLRQKQQQQLQQLQQQLQSQRQRQQGPEGEQGQGQAQAQAEAEEDARGQRPIPQLGPSGGSAAVATALPPLPKAAAATVAAAAPSPSASPLSPQQQPAAATDATAAAAATRSPSCSSASGPLPGSVSPAFLHRTINKFRMDEEPRLLELLTAPMTQRWASYFLAHENPGPTRGVPWDYCVPSSSLSILTASAPGGLDWGGGGNGTAFRGTTSRGTTAPQALGLWTWWKGAKSRDGGGGGGDLDATTAAVAVAAADGAGAGGRGGGAGACPLRRRRRPDEHHHHQQQQQHSGPGERGDEQQQQQQLQLPGDVSCPREELEAYVRAVEAGVPIDRHPPLEAACGGELRNRTTAAATAARDQAAAAAAAAAAVADNGDPILGLLRSTHTAGELLRRLPLPRSAAGGPYPYLEVKGIWGGGGGGGGAPPPLAAVQYDWREPWPCADAPFASAVLASYRGYVWLHAHKQEFPIVLRSS
ncbi:hypothetical protein PLESTB_001091100 [Pleodorina starrii]|uniref:Uncharacterized protein n=1 Tax=Pleodorina starrii TaxID=330485 RepID=A0A9W6F5E2_9CHLO|nr:hypothetical protein PLESTM_000695300 [Pleodorina starrii]GLC56311.1 hypothetical protein PLESTB_001091100 [Pleodorina starrii]GLC69654.1 hypothetical protein PLESTF_000859400 [Pleodorina starrii]